jgi:hypothetical protein
MDITVFRLRNTGTVFPGYEDLYNSRNKFIFTFDRPNNMCTLLCALVAIHGEEEFRKLVNQEKIIKKVKQVYKEIFDEPMPKNFGGVEVISTLRKVQEKHNITFHLFTRNSEKRYEEWQLLESQHENAKIVNLLFISSEDKQHLMYIKDLEGLTSFHICPKCKLYCQSNSGKHGHRHKELMDKHIEKCDGKFHTKLSLPKFAEPYDPVMRNELWAYLFAHNRKEEYKPETNYLVFDIETVNGIVNESFGKGSVLESTLPVITSAWGVITGEKEHFHTIYRRKHYYKLHQQVA